MDVHLSDEELHMIFAFLDKDNSGHIYLEELIRGLAKPLNKDRLYWIKAAYNKLDANKNGEVTLDDIAKLYDINAHPDVQKGRKAGECYREFLSLFDTQLADGIVTFDEFCDYFKGMSAAIEDDAYFAQMMKNAWKL
jgi:Ca2+-binding EF-hand superfamily protein